MEEPDSLWMRKDFARFGRSLWNQEMSSSTVAPLLDGEFSKKAGALQKMLHPIQTLNKIEQNKTGLDTCAVCSSVPPLSCFLLCFLLLKIPRHNLLCTWRCCTQRFKNDEFWASGSVVYGTLFRNLNSFRSVAILNAAVAETARFYQTKRATKSCFSSCEPSQGI